MGIPKTDEDKQAFLDALSKSGVRTAAQVVAGVAYTTVSSWRQNDPEFAVAYDEAMEFAADSLEVEARRRAVEGVESKKFDKDGKLLFTTINYSDTLLIALLKANKPDKFADRSKAEISNPDGSLKSQNSTEGAARIIAILDDARRQRAAGIAPDPLFE